MQKNKQQKTKKHLIGHLLCLSRIISCPARKTVSENTVFKSHFREIPTVDYHHTLHIKTFFFFFFLIWVLRPFQEYFTYIEPIVHRRWAKTGEKPPDHP